MIRTTLHGVHGKKRTLNLRTIKQLDKKKERNIEKSSHPKYILREIAYVTKREQRYRRETPFATVKDVRLMSDWNMYGMLSEGEKKS